MTRYEDQQMCWDVQMTLQTASETGAGEIHEMGSRLGLPSSGLRQQDCSRD